MDGPDVVTGTEEGQRAGSVAPPPDMRRAVERAGLTSPGAWEPLVGGRSNRCWRAPGAKGPVVVKLYAPSRVGQPNPLFPNDPEAEASVLEHLAGTGLAPHRLGSLTTPDGPVLVYAHLKDVARTDAAAAAALVSRVHAQPAPPLRRVSGDPGALIAQADRILSNCPATAARNDIAAARPDRTPPLATGEPRLLHGDPVPANIIGTATGPVLIDWQCPALGDPVLDLHVLLSPSMRVTYDAPVLAPAEVEAALTAYGDPQVAARYRALAPILHWRMTAYCLWRGDDDAARGKRAIAAGLAAIRT